MHGRSAYRYLTAAFRGRHYRTAVRLPFQIRRPLRFARRYVIGGGAYPVTFTIRTPVGPTDVTAYSGDDVVTVAEVFCRDDYRVDASVRTVVDVGANIGISATYFLTRNPHARVWCFEPAPQNVPRLRRQLEAFGDRAAVEAVAVGPTRGEIDFGVEPTGRYGSALASRPGLDRITVPCRHIDDVVEAVLAEVPRIDVLKLDIEGWEVPTLEALRPDLAESIDMIVFEGAPTEGNPLPEAFSVTYREPVHRMVRRSS